MSARSTFQSVQGRRAKQNRNNSTGKNRRKDPLNGAEPLSGAVNLMELNLFGPQNQWGCLLREREQLHYAIKLGQEHLEQFRKHVNTCSALLQTWSDFEPEADKKLQTEWLGPVAATSSMEQLLSDRISWLEQRLAAVTQELDGLSPEEPCLEPQSLEESIFTLLRAAG